MTYAFGDTDLARERLGLVADTFEAPTRFDKLFTGVVVPRPGFIEKSNWGSEHIGPEDTFDADYGRLLERVCSNGKWVARPAGLEPATSWFVA